MNITYNKVNEIQELSSNEIGHVNGGWSILAGVLIGDYLASCYKE